MDTAVLNLETPSAASAGASPNRSLTVAELLGRVVGVSDHVFLRCRPFATQPSMDQWLALIETAAALRERHGTDLVVIDSLTHFLPAHSENSASAVLQSGVEAAFGENWQAVLGVLSVATVKLTRQEILDHWPEGYDKPDATTLWRWLSRAVAQGVVPQDGTGRPGEPFRYWLPAREDMVRPDGESKEELRAWNERCFSEIFDKLTTKANAQAQTLLPAGGDTAPVEPPAAPETTVLAPEPIEPEPAPSASPDPARSHPAEVGAPDPPVRLPFPYNIMTPADVRPDVWERARAAAKSEAERGQ